MGLQRQAQAERQRAEQKEQQQLAKAEARKFDSAFTLGKELGIWGEEAKARSTEQLLAGLQAHALKQEQSRNRLIEDYQRLQMQQLETNMGNQAAERDLAAANRAAVPGLLDQLGARQAPAPLRDGAQAFQPRPLTIDAISQALRSSGYQPRDPQEVLGLMQSLTPAQQQQLIEGTTSFGVPYASRGNVTQFFPELAAGNPKYQPAPPKPVLPRDQTGNRLKILEQINRLEAEASIANPKEMPSPLRLRQIRDSVDALRGELARLDGTGAPAPADEPAAPAAQPKPQPLPKTQAEAKAGMIYQTPRGLMRYLGNGQFQPVTQ